MKPSRNGTKCSGKCQHSACIRPGGKHLTLQDKNINILWFGMPKRKLKGKSERASRLKYRQRMREARQQKQIPSDEPNQTLENSATSCEVVDGAVSAPLGYYPGQVSMGFPLKEEKPLARMQASLRERMHPNALSSASSQGSRLCAQNGGMAPSPDSPPWVCTSPRVPEPDTVHVSGSAGQAQLGMSSSFSGDESSRIQIDAPRNLTRTKKNSERKLCNDPVYMRNECDDDDDDEFDDDNDDGTNSNSMSTTNKVKETSKGKYLNDEHYRTNLIQKGVQKYALDAEHRMKMKQKSIAKYQTDESHKQDVKNKSKIKYKADNTHKENVKRMSTQKYKLDEMHRQNVKKRSTEKYKLDEDHREKVKVASKTSYHLSLEAKRLKKEKVSKKRQERMEKLKGESEVVNLFKNTIKQGPEYTCCCCHRLLFENQVRGCTHEMYTENHQARNVADQCIDDKYVHQCGESCTDYCPRSTLWVCFTCHRKIMSGKIPQEAAINKMSLEEIPPELSDLNSLEQHLIALHIPFMKIMALPQGGQRNVHGPVVCVPSNIKKTTSLPLNVNENLLLRVKLKRKLSYKGYFEYQFVSSRHIKAALEFLKENNKWYQDVSINSNWTDNDDHCLMSDTFETYECEQEIPEIEKNHNQEVVSDTCLQPVDIAQEVLDHYFDDVYNIAPGEGQNPVRMLQEEGNEAKSFPHLFPSGRFSWNEDRDERITLSRYFNNRLMNTDNRFAKDTNYIFFAQFMSELKQVIEKTQISIRKSLSKSNDGKLVTSDMLQDPSILSKLLKNDEALRFMQPIRGTPAYWSTTQKDLFAMLRQLGIPTWFCSFSAAEFRWNEIVGCILHHEDDNRNPSDLDWSEKSEILRRNPVTVARMFEHRFHVFQKEVILAPANPIGSVVDYFVRVEFQQRGSPHMHCLYWVEDAPKFGEDSEERVCDFIDKYVSCSLPNEDDEQELRQTALSVQQHSKNHTKSCRKKGTECRFNFPRPPSERTFIAEQCEEDAESIDTNLQMNTSQAKDTLLKVWNKVLDDNSETQTAEEILAELSLSQENYEKAHRVLTPRTTTILKRDPKEMWTNQYNECLLKCWDANMDIQYVLDPFSCIVYIISYISKSEREMGMLLKQTKIEATEGNLSAKQTIKKIGSAYLNYREVSAQEAVYRVCNLKMKECSRKVVFIPVGENPTRLSKPLSQLKRKRRSQSDECEGDEDEEDIWMTNIVERYENRPQTDFFNQMCLAVFCSEFRVLAKSQIPQGEKEGVYELQNGKGYIQKRTRGDFYQLPPVKQRKDERLYRVNDTYPVDYWLDFFNIIELDEIMRQREDVEFATVLNYLRVRTIDEQISNEALTVLRDCIREGPDDVLHVYSTNDEVNNFNLGKLQTCCADFVEVDAEDYQKDKTTGRLKLREKPLIATKTDGLSSSLLLAVNARVMLTRNVNVEDGLVNGAMGYVSHFEFGGDQRKNIIGVGVTFDSKEIGKLRGTMTPNGNRIVIQRIQEEIKEKSTKNVVRHQFPLKLSWACTAHKVQGMTTDKIVVNLYRTFAAGQAYVAISRVTSKDGLFIETADEDKLKKKIYADPDVKTSLSIMQRFVPSGVGEIGQIQTEECKTILVLNVQSLRAHIQDIKSDNRLTNTDLICLTETWLRNQEDLSEFEIPGFNFHSFSRGMCYDDSSTSFSKLSQARGGGIGVFQRKEENIRVHELPLKNIELEISTKMPDRKDQLRVIYSQRDLNKELIFPQLKEGQS
ncbi:uncharacterized protein [Magallana gigas]|uniref:uncharacterized protein n=1 Tax=Magallana gigas TaxID=29159 RepID=UPI00333ECAAE